MGLYRKLVLRGRAVMALNSPRFLIKHNVSIYEVMRPNRMDRRVRGKTDTLDSENAARCVLSGKAKTIPKSHSGSVESLRSLLVTRNSAVKARTQAVNQIKALLVSGPDELKQSLYLPKPVACASACLHLCSGRY